jgi:photosystem II stability/assembly factor-like uncharacterized protein
MFKSTDQGAEWRRINQGLPRYPDRVAAIAVHPIDPSRVSIAMTDSDARVWANRIFVSDDGGSHWRRSNSPRGDKREASVCDLAFTPGDSPALLAATDDGVFRTTDGGSSWTRLTAQFGSIAVERLVVDAADPLTLYAAPAAFRGLLRSHDGGATWTLAANAGYVTN